MRKIANPRFFRAKNRRLPRRNAPHSKVEKDTPERAKHRKVVARVHERIAWRRSDFTHQHSRRIVNAFDLIAVEDLSVNRMVHNHCLAKSIHDVAWSQFASPLSYKAAWAGRRYVAVNPAYTSQDCSQCGHRKTDLSLADRTYTCPCCGRGPRPRSEREPEHFETGATVSGFGLEAPGFIRESCHWYLIELPILLGQGIAVVILATVSRQRGWIIGAAVALALTILAPFLLSEISHAIDANTDIFNPRSMYDGDVRLFQAQLVFTVVLFALQLLYLAYGVRRTWRIWRSTGLGSRSASATPLPSAQS